MRTPRPGRRDPAQPRRCRPNCCRRPASRATLPQTDGQPLWGKDRRLVEPCEQKRPRPLLPTGPYGDCGVTGESLGWPGSGSSPGTRDPASRGQPVRADRGGTPSPPAVTITGRGVGCSPMRSRLGCIAGPAGPDDEELTLQKGILTPAPSSVRRWHPIVKGPVLVVSGAAFIFVGLLVLLGPTGAHDLQTQVVPCLLVGISWAPRPRRIPVATPDTIDRAA